MRASKWILAAAVAAVTAAAVPAAGHAEDDWYVKTRQGVMKAMGGHLKALAAVAKGEAAADAATPVHAMAVEELSHTITALFPYGSTAEKSRAKPDVWDRRGDFFKAANDLTTATPALLAAAKTGDRAQIGGALKDVGKACGGCHKPFRKPKKK